MKINTLVVLLFSSIIYAQVGINTTNPDASSMLDVVSNDKGILIPRMTVSERISIGLPAQGLLVYQTDDIDGFYYFNGTQWIRLLDYQRDGVPVSAVFAFPVETPPLGYLICNGSAISRTTYANLFAVIGTMYGSGDGSTTFNLPDYRGEFLRGVDSGTGNDPDALTRLDRGDGASGDVVGSKQFFENSQHNHNIAIPTFTTDPVANHTHYTQSYGASTSLAGGHNHTASFSGSTNYAGSHNHTVPYRIVEVEDPGTFDASINIRELYPGTGTIYSNAASSHSHSVYGTVNVNSTGNHNHTFFVPSLAVSSGGAHSHTTTIPSFNSSDNGGSETRPRNVNVVWCIKY